MANIALEILITFLFYAGKNAAEATTTICLNAGGSLDRSNEHRSGIASKLVDDKPKALV